MVRPILRIIVIQEKSVLPLDIKRELYKKGRGWGGIVGVTIKISALQEVLHLMLPHPLLLLDTEAIIV